MAELRPFKGIRYNQEISGDLSKNICPPFDSISPSLQKNLYEISNFNTVRLELGLRGLDSDPYFSAAETQKTWMKEGILIQDDSPSIYVTEEEFSYNNKKLLLHILRLYRPSNRSKPTITIPSHSRLL